MRFKCLVFDHDDTTVDSTRNVHYPCFREFMKIYRPELSVTLEDYVRYNFAPGVLPFFRDICGLSETELTEEENYWRNYAKTKVSPAFPKIREIMEKEKASGGYIAVVSHSFSENILRDYAYNGLPVPDMVFGWETPHEKRKPHPDALFEIMERFDLKPEEMLMIDDLKPGLDMARAAGVPFAAAGWCFSIPEIESTMRKEADYYFDKTEALADFLKSPAAPYEG